MNWAKIYAVVKAIASLSGIMAFVGFSYTFYKDFKAGETAQARSWQAIEIFSIVLEADDKGLSLNELVAGVQNSMIEGRAFVSINPNVATKNQVLAGIVELAAKNSIILGTDGNYRVPLQLATMLGHEAEAQRIRNLQNSVLELVQANPLKFSSDELRAQMRREGAAELDIQRAMTPLLMDGPWGPPMLVTGGPTAGSTDVMRFDQKLEIIR